MDRYPSLHFQGAFPDHCQRSRNGIRGLQRKKVNVSTIRVRISRAWIVHLIIFAGLLLNLSLPLAVLAQGGGTFSLTPYSLETQTDLPRFVFDAEAGQSFQSAVLVKNEGSEPVHVQLYAADARTSVNGDLDFSGRTDVPVGVGLWISIEQPDLTLAAGESQIVPFTVHVPDTARSGNHRAGIMAETIAPEVGEGVAVDSGQVSVKYLFREGLNVRITLPGPTKIEFAIAGVTQATDNNDTIFNVEMINSGSEDVQIAGGQIQISDANGKVIGEQPIPLSGLFLAGDTVSPQVRFTGLLPEGHYSVQASVDYGANAPTQSQSEFDIVPAAQGEVAAEVNRGFALAPSLAEQSDSVASVTAAPVEAAAVTTEPVAGGESIWVYVIAGMALIIVLGIVISLIIWVARSRPSSPQDDYRLWGKQ
jgi:hypothetical protein